MTERLRSSTAGGYNCPKMENDLSPRKTMLVVVIVVGCFAVLWPKVFYPMLVGSANQQIKPSPIDKSSGCCDVISETDVNTIKIMSELCGTIIKGNEDRPLTGKEIVQRCRQEILDTCGIDVAVVLQEQVRLGQNVKQILDEVRSLNGSLCLKYNYGIAPWRLGVPHRVTVKSDSVISNIRQERPMHLRTELVHPAFRERGRAIPQLQAAAPTRPPPKIVEGRPGPIPGMRPTIGGAGHVVPPSKQATSSMSIIMPIYTIGIVIFFTYTLMKIIFKKQPENVTSIYPPVDPDPHFRKEVFESESSRLGTRLTRENVASKLGDVELDHLRQRLRETELAMERIVEQMSKVPLKTQDLVNGTLSNGNAVKPQDEEQPTVKVLGMEMTASCEGGKKWSRPNSPVLPTSPPPSQPEPVSSPQEIYLEGALPAQSHLLVAESAIEPEPTTGEDPAVVLSGKMTLSVISLDSENGLEESKEATETTLEKELENDLKTCEKVCFEESPIIEDLAVEHESLTTPLENTGESETEQNNETEFEQQLVGLEETKPPSAIEKDIEEFLQSLKKQQDFEAPSITLENEYGTEAFEVKNLEKEVDDLIREAIENIGERNAQLDIIGQTNESSDETQNEDEVIEVLDEAPQTKQSHLLVSGDILEPERENSPQPESDIAIGTTKLVQLVDNLPLKEQKSANNGLSVLEPASSIVNTDADLTELPEKQKSLEKEEEIAKLDANSSTESVETVTSVKPSSPVQIEQKLEPPSVKPDDSRTSESDEEELGSDEELVEEIEEIVYEEETEDEDEEEVEFVNEGNRTESGSIRRFNGERSDDLVEESKYTTVSGATAAENDISDEEVTDEEEVEEEIIEIEEEIEDEVYENEDVNHVSEDSDHEL